MNTRVDVETFKIGITGTRKGMSVYQLKSVRERMKTLYHISCESVELHHGDCVGVDVQAAEVARSMGIKTVCHPPADWRLRAHHKSDVTLEQKTYFARNRDIVDVCDILFVIPIQTSHSSKGGTWYTHDYAVKQDVPVEIFFPARVVEQSTLDDFF